MPVATFPQTASNGEVLALNSSQAADVALLRADQSPVSPATLFGRIARTGPPSGVALPGHAAEVQLVARLGPASLGLAPVTVNVSVQDADNNVYQLDAGTLPADGQDHTLTVTLANQAAASGGSGSGSGGAGGAIYPLRLTSVSLDYTLPAKRPPGRPPSPWTASPPGRERASGPARRSAPGRPPARPPSWPASARPPAPSDRRACPPSRPRVRPAARCR